MNEIIGENNTSSFVIPPKWFWIVSAIALLWNLVGVAAFFSQMSMDLNSLSDAKRMFHESTPFWATAAFAIAVFGGSLGCVALLFRQSWAISMLAICVLGIVVQAFHSVFVGNGIEVFGTAGLLFPLLTLAIGAALVCFASYSQAKGWIGKS